MAARVMFTRWVSGRRFAAGFTKAGMPSSGKKAPLNRNIGVMKRKIDRFKLSV